MCYHSVQPGWASPLNTEPNVFERHSSWFSRHRSVVPLAQGVSLLDRRGRLPRGCASLTFDDGFAALHQHAFPILLRHRLPATVFLVAETLTARGRPVDWVDTPPPYPLTTLSPDQVLEMAEAGVDFQSHSYSHLDLTALSFDACVQDLRRSREVLEDLLGRRVQQLAYPRGRNNETVRKAAAAAGFQHSFTLPEAHEPVDEHGLPRVGIYQGNGVATVKVKCSRPYLPLRTSAVFPMLRRVVPAGRSRVRPSRPDQPPVPPGTKR